MKRFITALLAAAVAGALFVASPLVAAPKGTSYNKSVAHITECDGGTINIFAPDKLWPPNHKYVDDLFVEAVDNDPEGTVSQVTTGTHDQYVEGDNGLEEQNGAGNTGDDITSDDAEATIVESNDENSGFPNIVATESDTGTVTTDWKARAERSGRDQTGRVYTLTADVEFSDGSSCSADLDMIVPHDMRPSNR